MPDPTPAPTTVMTITQMWTMLIPILATSVILPMWNMWLASQNASKAEKAIAVVTANQELTHAKQEETTAKVEEIHQMTNGLLESQSKKDGQ